MTVKLIQHQTRMLADLKAILSGQISAFIVDAEEEIFAGEPIRLDAEKACDQELDTSDLRLAKKFPDLDSIHPTDGLKHAIILKFSDGSQREIDQEEEDLIGPDDDLERLLEAGNLSDFNIGVATRYPYAPINNSVVAQTVSIEEINFSQLEDRHALALGYFSAEKLKEFIDILYPHIVAEDRRIKVVNLRNPQSVARPAENEIYPYLSPSEAAGLAFRKKFPAAHKPGGPQLS